MMFVLMELQACTMKKKEGKIRQNNFKMQINLLLYNTSSQSCAENGIVWGTLVYKFIKKVAK